MAKSFATHFCQLLKGARGGKEGKQSEKDL